MSKEITFTIKIHGGDKPPQSQRSQELRDKQRKLLMKEKQKVTNRAALEQLNIKQLTQQITRKNHTIDLSLQLVRDQSGVMKLLEEQLKHDPSSRLKGTRVMTATEINKRHPQLPHQIQEHSLVMAWNTSRTATQIPSVRIVINTDHALLFYNKFGLVQEIREDIWRKHPESLSDALNDARRNPRLINASDFWRTDRNTFLKPQPLPR